MSALGHKQTYAAQNGMSVLPPKADICSANTDVRLFPTGGLLFGPLHSLDGVDCIPLKPAM